MSTDRRGTAVLGHDGASHNGKLPPGVTVGGNELLIPRIVIIPFPDQPRSYFNQPSLRRLARSMKTRGQRQPIDVRPLTEEERRQHPGCFYQLIDGQRRWHASEIAEMPNLRAVLQFPKDADEQYRMSVASNFNHEKHPPLEIRDACLGLRKRGDTIEEICDTIGLSDSAVALYLRLENLHPDIEALLAPELDESARLQVNVAVQLAKLAKDRQPAGLKETKRRGGRVKDAAAVVNEMLAADSTARNPDARVRERKPSDDSKLLVSAVGQLSRVSGDLYAHTLDRARFALVLPADRRGEVVQEVDNAIRQLQQFRAALVR